MSSSDHIYDIVDLSSIARSAPGLDTSQNGPFLDPNIEVSGPPPQLMGMGTNSRYPGRRIMVIYCYGLPHIHTETLEVSRPLVGSYSTS